MASEEAALYVAQLAKEVGPGHSLFGRVGRLVALAVRDDDVLFQDQDASDQFYVVHLTYGPAPQEPPFPWVSPLRLADLDRDFFMEFRG
ncbi:MAG: hypothetical protein AAGA87_10820 [Pseudomonadota bacterium]